MPELWKVDDPPCKPITWACGHVARFADPEKRAFMETHLCPVCSVRWESHGCAPAPRAAEEAKAA